MLSYSLVYLDEMLTKTPRMINKRLTIIAASLVGRLISETGTSSPESESRIKPPGKPESRARPVAA